MEYLAIIEIQANTHPVKYEYSKEGGFLKVDRVLTTSMTYPYHYGYFPSTLGLDGDPLDTLVYCNFPIIPGSGINVRPIGFLELEDESGIDEKIISVPTSSVTTEFEHIKSCEDLPPAVLKKIEHFFIHYKDLDNAKWTKVGGWRPLSEAKKLIKESEERHKKGKA